MGSHAYARRGVAVLVLAAVLGGAGAVPAAAEGAEPAAGTLLPHLYREEPSLSWIGTASPAYVAYAYAHPGDIGDSLEVRRIADGSLVREIPGPVQGQTSPRLEGTSWVQAVEDPQSDDVVAVETYDVETGVRTHLIEVPAGDRFVTAGTGWILTGRPVPESGREEAHLVRTGSDVATGVPMDNSTGDRLYGHDDRSILFRNGTRMYTIDLADGVSRLVTVRSLGDDRALLGPTRIYWIDDEYVNGAWVDRIHWVDRTTGATGASPAVAGAVSDRYLPYGDGIATLRPAATRLYRDTLVPVDLTTGQLGGDVAGQIIWALPMDDGRVTLVLADSTAGRVAVAEDGEGVRTVRDLPPIASWMESLRLSGNQVVASRWEDEAVFTAAADGSSGWSSAGDGQGALVAGDIVATKIAERRRPSTDVYRLSWPGGSREVEATYGGLILGHGGEILMHGIPEGTHWRWETQEAKSGAVLPTPPGVGHGHPAVDRTWVWTGPVGGNLIGTDVSGVTSPRKVPADLPCTGELQDVRGRWALLSCSPTAVYVRDMQGVVPTYELPLQEGDRRPVIGAGYVAWLRPASQDGPTALLVAELAQAHETRAYGPVRAGGWTTEGPVAVDDAGGTHVVYVDPERQVRRVELDWLDAVPAGEWVEAPPPPDVTAPQLGATSGSPRLVAATGTSTLLSFRWTYTDTGTGEATVSGLAGYDVRYQRRPAGGAYGGWQEPAAWQDMAKTSTSVTLAAPRDTDTCFQVRARDGAGNTSAWSTSRCTEVDAAAPAMKSASAGPRVLAEVLPTMVTFSYAAQDRNGVASYEVATRRATPGAPLGAWGTPSGWRSRDTPFVVTEVRPGAEVCFRARARDAVGNVSAWSAPDCVTVPYDDNAFLPWGTIEQKSKVQYTSDRRSIDDRGVAVLQEKGGAIRRSGLTGRQIALYVIRGPGQGRVEVLVNGRTVGRVDLAASAWRRELVYLPTSRETWKGTVVVRSLTGANARIDAVAVLR